MAETIGSLVDKISISQLKIIHMQEQVERADVTEAHRALCRQRVTVMKEQCHDLTEELSDLFSRWKQGTWLPKIYRQFKMYNDPTFRAKSPASK